MDNFLKSSLNLIFNQTSFFGVSGLGVAQCLVDHGQAVLGKTIHYGGESSSAIVAAILATDPMKVQDYFEALYLLVEEISELQYGAVTPGFDLVSRMRGVLDQILPLDAHEKATNRLFIKCVEMLLVDKYSPLSVYDVDQGSSSAVRTNGPRRFEVGRNCWQLGREIDVTSFSCREELIETLLGAVYVPWFLDWRPPSINNQYFGDITLARKENFPVETKFNFPSGQVVKISPGPRNHVTMRDKIAMGWLDTTGQRFDISALQMFRVGNGLFPPPKDYLKTYLADGYEDATKFLKFYHSYEENEKGYKPREEQYANVHFVSDLK